ncbi:MAG: response regulator [Lachnospiraceae bacterium]|nr:response regulator [Lachnospiraceae bacterium]
MNRSMIDGKVVIVSASDTFLARSLITKLDSTGIQSEFAHPGVKEIGAFADDMELVILFMSEELEAIPNTLVYLNDTVQDKGVGLILIGDQAQYEIVTKVIPENAVLEWFQRPLDMDRLIKRITACMDDSEGENRKKSILIVDDDITYMRSVFEWLKDKYHVGMAVNGVQAISYLAKKKVDLILLDYEMPIANGPQVLSMLKNDTDTGNIPVMFLTGHSDKESVMSVVGLKPADYLLKTIDKENLLKKLDSFFKR